MSKQKTLQSIIKSCGAYLPSKVITNNDLSKIVDTNDEWITSRTGIKARHVVENADTTTSMAIKAAKIALDRANVSPHEVDLIIVGTTTPDKTFPATAVQVQASLQIKNCTAFDVQAVCAGFIYCLSIADSLLKTGQNKNALVIGADSMSKLVDWTDRGTCVLFGDGAGAVFLTAEQTDKDHGIIATKLYADGGCESILYASGGVATTQNAGFIKMNGREVFRHAVEKMSHAMEEVLNISGYGFDDLTYVIPHQANIRILEAIASKLKISPEKLVVTLQNQGNTSAATIPLAINCLFEENKLRNGDLILTSALGGGLSWGAALLRW